jgi:RecA-family ATPase
MNAQRCSPPLPGAEVSRIAESIARYEPARAVAASALPTVANNDDATADSKSFDLDAARVTDLIGTTPPARRWLVSERLPLDVVGLLAAAGGTGKGMATLQLAVSVATGWPWLDQEISETGPVMMFSAEDAREEIHRRLATVLELYADEADPFAIDAFEEYHPLIAERLFVFDRVGEDNRLTAQVDRETIPTGFADRIIDTASQMPEPPKLIVLDPLARFDGGDPNDNSDGTRLIEAAERIRKATGATVLLPHHVAKGSMKDSQAGQEAVRGASGLVDGARWVGMLAGMKPDQAKTYGIDDDEVGMYVQFTTPKANYSAPWPGVWLKRRPGGALVPTALKSSKQTARERQAEDAYAEVLPKIIEKVRQAAEQGDPLTRRRLREYAGTGGVFGIGDQSLRGLIARAIDEGHVKEHEGGQGARGVKVLKTW